MSSAYSETGPIDILPRNFYQCWAKTNNLQTIVLSGTATPEEYKQWEQSLPSSKVVLSKIESYCRARLDEIREINKAHPSLTAFSVIPAFIGFLGSISISRNYYIRQKIGGGGAKRYTADRVCDEHQFRCFVRKFMLSEKHYLKRSRIDNGYRGIDWVLYKIVRCGLVHRYSLSNTRKNVDQKRMFDVLITHSSTKTGISELDQKLLKREVDKKIQIQLSALDLCDWIEAGLDRLFGKGLSPMVKNSILVNFRKSTPVSFVYTAKS